MRQQGYAFDVSQKPEDKLRAMLNLNDNFFAAFLFFKPETVRRLSLGSQKSSYSF